MTQPELPPPAPAESCAACTIISPNYLAYARTLAKSYLVHHPGQRFYVLLVADLFSAETYRDEPFTAIPLSAIGLRDLRGEAMKYDILELNTNVKPTFLKHLLEQRTLERLVYLDPDIFCYSPLAPVFRALEEHDLVLTPHLTTPVDDGFAPSEQDHLYNGTYNLGFCAVRNTPGSRAILDWWERRCLDNGFSEGRTGLFVDQKWMNLAPGLFERVAILRHAGCNMAYWNLHERTLTGGPAAPTVNDSVPLCFFHFSGIDARDPASLSKNTDRYRLADRADLAVLFSSYKAAVESCRAPGLESQAYGFGTFSDGTVVTRLARRIYARHQAHFPQADPFAASGPFYAFARAEHLIAGKATPQKSTWREFSPRDKRVELVHKLLRTALRTLGPNRYELLMRYLAFIAVLRNQGVFLNRGLPTSGKA